MPSVFLIIGTRRSILMRCKSTDQPYLHQNIIGEARVCPSFYWLCLRYQWEPVGRTWYFLGHIMHEIFVNSPTRENSDDHRPPNQPPDHLCSLISKWTSCSQRWEMLYLERRKLSNMRFLSCSSAEMTSLLLNPLSCRGRTSFSFWNSPDTWQISRGTAWTDREVITVEVHNMLKE